MKALYFHKGCYPDAHFIIIPDADSEEPPNWPDIPNSHWVLVPPSFVVLVLLLRQETTVFTNRIGGIGREQWLGPWKTYEFEKMMKGEQGA